MKYLKNYLQKFEETDNTIEVKEEFEFKEELIFEEEVIEVKEEEN